jgi:uncharacterized protein (TIRG00374 family)
MEKAFASWKVYAAILFGLIIVSWMLYRSIEQTHFIENKAQGNYCWVDINHDKKIDFSNEKEFTPCLSGDFKKEKFTDIFSQIQWNTISIAWMLLALICMFGRDLAYIIRIRILTHKALTWKSAFNVILIWEFASAISPGVVGGVSVAMFILNKEKIALGRSTAIVIITALLDNLFFLLLIPLVFLFVAPEVLFPTSTGLDKGVSLVFWGGFFLILFICFILFVGVFIYPQVIGKILSLLCKLPVLKRFESNISKLDEDIRTTSNELRKEKVSFWFKSFGSTFVSWSCRYLVINCVMAAFLSLSFYDHFFILGKQLVLWLFMHISPTPGGSGVAEYAFGELMSSFSSSMLLITGLAIIWRLISYFPYLIIGSILLPSWLKSKKETKDSTI